MSYMELSITEKAKQAIIDDDNKYSSALSSLEFLEDDSNFKKLPEVIRDAMISQGYCTRNQNPYELADILKELVREQGLEKYKVDRWLLGRTRTIEKRTDVIKLCFALKLDREQSNEFLNKCCHNALSFRNAEDVTFIYCILKGKSYQDAENIYSDYLKAKYNDDEYSSNQEPALHSGETTLILSNDFEFGDWETDDAFLKTYLIKNKAKFINYETTALKTYYFWKNEMFFCVINSELIDEDGEIEDYKNGDRGANPQTALALRSALTKHSSSTSLLYPAYNHLNNNLSNSIAALKKVKQICDNNQDLNSQKIISDFCYDIIESEKLLKRVLSSLEMKEHRDIPMFRCVLGLDQCKNSSFNLKELKVGKLPLTEENIERIINEAPNLYSNSNNSSFNKADDEKSEKKLGSNSLAVKLIRAIQLLVFQDGLPKEDIVNITYANFKKNEDKGYYYVSLGNKTKKLSETTAKAILDYQYASGIGRLRKKGDSSLYDNKSLHGSVMKKFPDGKVFHIPDNKTTKIGEDISVRKTFVLIYLLFYIYCLSLESLSYDYFTNLITEFSYESAFNQLNDLLTECNFSKLYYADAYDWLVLKCIKEGHRSYSSEALDFLNEIIDMSYNTERKDNDK